MAKKTTAKAENIVKEEAQAVAESPKVEEAPKAEEKKAPVVAAGDHFKTVRMRFKTTVCADYGTFYKGETGEIALYIANELEKCGAGEIIKE